MKIFLLKKKVLIFIFTLLLFLANYSLSSAQEIDVYCNSAILIDAKTGNVLYEKNANEKAYPASTTKILTAYIALSQGYSMNEQIVPSRNSVMSVPVGSSIAYFSENEKLTLEQVLYGLLLPSGNDAANILAEHISGSTNTFADLMNVTAEKLGATNSHFTNPSGLHNSEHYTTAADLAKIAQQAMKFEKFREIVAQSKYDMPVTNISKQVRTFINTNKLLSSGGDYFYPYATGIKTGYTSQAGNCLIASASKDGVDLITVVLGGHIIPINKSEVYLDTITLFNYGFENYHNQQLVAQNQTVTNCVPKNGKRKINFNKSKISLFEKETLNLAAANSLNVLVENGDTPTFESIITLNENIKAPIKKGDILGTITYKNGNETVGISNLIAQTDIEKEHIMWVVLRILLYFVVSVIMLGVLLRIYNTIRKFLRKQRRKKGIR